MNITRKLTGSASVISIKGYYCRITNNSSESGYFCIGKDQVHGDEDTVEVKAGCSATICPSLRPIHAIGNGDFAFLDLITSQDLLEKIRSGTMLSRSPKRCLKRQTATLI